MVKVVSSINKAVTMTVSGVTIKCMALVLFTILMVLSPIRVNGKKTSLMVKEKYIMTNKGQSRVLLTTLTSTNLMMSGSNMRGNLKATQRKVLEDCTLPMVIFIKGSSIEIWYMESELLNPIKLKKEEYGNMGDSKNFYDADLSYSYL